MIQRKTLTISPITNPTAIPWSNTLDSLDLNGRFRIWFAFLIICLILFSSFFYLYTSIF